MKVNHPSPLGVLCEGKNTTNHNQPPCRFHAGAAIERLSSPNGGRLFRLTDCLLVLLVAVLFVGCATTADLLPPGPVASIPPDKIVVFGKVELEWGDKKPMSPFTFSGKEKLLIAQLKKIKDEGYYYTGSSQLAIAYDSGEDFYAIVPKEDYAFQQLILERHPFLDPHRIKCRNFGFRIPQEASAVYVGTLVFHQKQKPRYFFGLLGGEKYFTLSVRDEYDDAVVRFQDRNPHFSGPIVKSIFHYGAVESGAREDDTSCSYFVPSKGFLLPLI